MLLVFAYCLLKIKNAFVGMLLYRKARGVARCGIEKKIVENA